MERYSSYKKANCQWLEEIPSHWKMIKVKYVAKLLYKGSGITKEEVYDDGDTPCVRYGEIYSRYNHSFTECISATCKDKLNSFRFFDKGDILFAGTGELIEEIGKSIVYLGDSTCLAGGDIIVLKHNQNPSFLNYVLNTFYTQQQKSYGKSKLKVVHISSSEIGRIVIFLPPLSEQKIIASYLDTQTSHIDSLIADVEREIELLGEAKQRIIADAVTKGLKKDVEMKDSGISWCKKIPTHWEQKRIASIFSSKPENNSDFKFKHAYKFNYGTIVPKNEIGNPDEYREIYEKYSVVKKDDIMINGLNLNYDFISQRVAIVPDDGIITSAYLVMRPKNTIIPMYYCYLFKAMDSMKMFHGMGTGIRLTLSFQEIKKYLVPIPPIEEQQAIVDFISQKTSQIDTLISSLSQQITSLKEYKQRLISDVVTGQIKVC